MSNKKRRVIYMTDDEWARLGELAKQASRSRSALLTEALTPGRMISPPSVRKPDPIIISDDDFHPGGIEGMQASGHFGHGILDRDDDPDQEEPR